jgi:D-3-phosphoglycerate dehydrogenase / 2-oxoglutarate reductase
MRILVQGDMYVRVSILQACLEEALSDIGTPLEFETITLHHPAGEPRLSPTGEAKQTDTWNAPAEAGRTVYEFRGPIDLLVDHVADVDYVVMHTAAVTREVVAAGKRLKAIACARGGPVNVDIQAATDFGVPIIYAPGRNARAVAEFIMGMMLAYDRNIISGWDGLKQGLWREYRLYNYDAMSPGFDGRVLGMVGFGRVGRILSPLAKAFGMRLLAYDPYVDATAVAEYGVQKMDSLAELIPQSDFVVILARVTPETTHMIGAKELALMRPSAYLVNAARGPLLDYEALYAALKTGQIKGALLDTFAWEPLPIDNPLLSMDNVLLTPHIAGATREAVYCAGQMMAADIKRIILGQRPLNCLNPAVFNKRQIVQ